MKKFFVYLAEHIFEIIGLLGVASLAVFWKTVRDWFVAFVSLPYSGWIATAAVTIVVILYVIVKKLQSKKLYTGAFSIPQRPRKVMYTTTSTMFGVNWKLFMGTNSISGYLDPERVPIHDIYGYIEGPYCSMCDYELDTDKKKNVWQCAAGHKDVKIPKDVREHTEDKVTKILEADFRRQWREGKIK